LKSNVIFKQQTITDFAKFFSIFRMHLLLIVKVDTYSEILIECKTVDKSKVYKKEEFDFKNNINLVREKLKRNHVH